MLIFSLTFSFRPIAETMNTLLTSQKFESHLYIRSMFKPEISGFMNHEHIYHPVCPYSIAMHIKTNCSMF